MEKACKSNVIWILLEPKSVSRSSRSIFNSSKLLIKDKVENKLKNVWVLLPFFPFTQPTIWGFKILDAKFLCILAFSLSSIPSIGIFLLLWETNHLNTAKSTSVKLPFLIFLFLFEDFSKEVKSFSLFASHVETVFFGTPYFSATSLLDILFSKSFRTLHFSANVFTTSFLFGSLDKLLFYNKTQKIKP